MFTPYEATIDRVSCYDACWLLGWQAGVNDAQAQRDGHFDPTDWQDGPIGLFGTADVRLAFALVAMPDDLAAQAQEGYVCGFIQQSELEDQPVCDVDRQAVEEEREPFAAALLLDPKYHAAADCVLSQ